MRRPTEAPVSNAIFDERLGTVERRQSDLSSDMKVLQHDLTGLKGDVSKIGNDFQQQTASILQAIAGLKEKDAARPPNTNWRAVAATALGIFAGVASLSTATWWFIEVSPIVQNLDRRLTRLDDPEVGRVTQMQKEFGRWSPMVTSK